MTSAASRPTHQLATVSRQDSLGEGAYRLRLSMPAFPAASAGQFVMLRDTENGEPFLPRAMALYQAGRVGRRAAVEVVYRVVGRGTARLAGAAPGQRLWVLGPLGRAFALPQPGVRPVLVGGGTGIASLHLLGKALARGRTAGARRDVTVLIGARTRRQLLCNRDFRALGSRVQLATDDGTAGRRGTVAGLLENVLAEEARRGRPIGMAYVCGPTPMMEAAWRVCKGAGVECQVSLEGPMACGFGVCLGCAVPCHVADPEAPVRSPRDRMKLMCTDGPVFDAATLAWGWES